MKTQRLRFDRGLWRGLWWCIGFVAAVSTGWAQTQHHEALHSALTHHASFDQGLTAEYSRGDPVMRAFTNGADRKRGGSKAVMGEAGRIVPGAGKFGGALQRETQHPQKLFYHTGGILDYDPQSWSGTVSLWMRLTPEEDLEPGYCDPVMLIGSDGKKGFIFAEWSPGPGPRLFRYAIRPINELWNPQGLGWEEIPTAGRPMVEVNDAPFYRERWTHVVLTIDRVNTGKRASGRLYLDGRLQGTISDWDLTLGWTDTNVLLVLGTNYIGLMDDLAVFNRALTETEVATLHQLPQGVEDLY